MTALNIRADLYRVAAMFISDESTRYYLQGVFVEPHANGVTLTATDGHTLISIHDDTGSCSEPAIVTISDYALKACKPNKKDLSPRRLVVNPDGKALVMDGENELAISGNCYIDGTFPDWRRVVESAQSAEPSKHDPKVAAFDSKVLRPFMDAAKELSADKYHGVTMTSPTTSGPMFIAFPEAPHAFGLAMPYRAPDCVAGIPSWFHAKRLANAA